MATRTKTPTASKPATSTSRSASAAKAKSPAAKATAETPVPKAADAAPAPAPEAVVTERARRGDLLDALSERSPMRRADLKVMMELVLEETGRLLDEGDEIVLPPLGKLSVKKRVERPGGDMLTIKLKRLTPERAED
jgi:nucleoid DNA-binding protein